jgi:Serine dehydrogenase proteinase
MPTWGELQRELTRVRQEVAAKGGLQEGDPVPSDLLRRKYLARLSELTGRATIVYYSGFQQHPDMPQFALSVTPADMSGFMETCSNLTGERELDLYLHSPGGSADAVEQICAYLRTQFDHIRAIVPLNAMSAATMIALSADEILMGAHSQLGPIDPQFTISMPEGARTASAQAIKDQFELALEQCKDPANLNAWLPILRSYAPGMLARCDHAAEHAETIVAEALRTYMFKDRADAEAKAKEAAEWFGDAKEFLSHGRPVRREQAREHGIVVKDLEDDGELQDAVLSVHHAVLIGMANLPIAKLIENHKQRLWVLSGAQQIAMMLPPTGPSPLPAGLQHPQAKKPPPRSPRKRAKKR